MRNARNKTRLALALESVEQAAAVLIAISLPAEKMEAIDIADAINACSGLVNDARAELAILEGEE
ncbi:hypothetical protein JHE55_002220 [Salmonella enterica]|uniref:hypothetical protein n=1 Tax=Salmonella enterica TaxID=28901 RepID=UPI00071AE5A5|nr:hypothetical protein [Salmonella enterica]EGX7443830.1 hypothetical protein [Salmonella enterica]EGX9277037.1 hypothetical protein [Salmonella enterica]KSA98981.1 hypothetical protein LFZ11_00460 [Salmonella enterica subsp. enterica serovar Fresno str. ST224]